MVKNIISISILIILLISTVQAVTTEVPIIEWTRQFGTSGDDFAYGVSADNDVYVTGMTNGVLGDSNLGGNDVFITKYGSDGTVSWTEQFGTLGDDTAGAVMVDSNDIYIAGNTRGVFSNQNGYGDFDAFLSKHNINGDLTWAEQFGTSGADYARDVSVYSGIYTTGSSGSNAYVRKYNSNGDVSWDSQFTINGYDVARGVYADANGIYVVGDTGIIFSWSGWTPTLIPEDVFVRKYNSNGGLVWSRVFGTSSWDFGFDVAADSSGIYVVGMVPSALSGQRSYGNTDAYIRKYDQNGNVVWTRQFGTYRDDSANAVYADSDGIYVVGYMGIDAFVRKYDSDGNVVWTQTLSTSGNDEQARAVYADSTGIYVVGHTAGAFSGETNSGGIDAFLIKIKTGICIDDDNDGYPSDESIDCPIETDCDDNDNNRYPNRFEFCDQIDNDCDGSPAWYEVDNDLDGFMICQDDCDDTEITTYKDAFESCDGIDNNCRYALTDDGVDETWYNQPTICGVGECAATGALICSAGNQTDTCTPGTPTAELCDILDNDCDGSILDDGEDETWYNQVTNCGVGECARTGNYICTVGSQNDTCTAGTPTSETCDGLDNDCDGIADNGFDNDGDGASFCDGDCNDNDNTISPFLAEVCDGKDNDCNGLIDDGVCAGTCIDTDNDRYGLNNDPTCQRSGYDCNDNEFFANLGRNEDCDTTYDDDCDGIVNNGCDNDGDGYDAQSDCNDYNANINPGATEVCNSQDDNCDGQIDENGGCTDSDGDGIIDAIDICPSDPDNECNINKTQQYITNTTSTLITTENNETSLQISLGDVSEDTVITIERNDGTAPNFGLSTGVPSVKNIYTYSFSPEGMQFGGPILITFNWLDEDDDGREDITNLKEDNMDVWWFNTVTLKWEAQGATCDLTANYCTLITDHFSYYAIAASEDSDGDGYTDDDCDDTNPDINPGADDSYCDGIDNNCDGEIDDGYVATATNCGIGVCSSVGEMVCVDGQEIDACVPNEPSGLDDNCDGLDDNCDGSNDNNYVPIETFCGVGMCANVGEMVCSEGEEGDTCVKGEPEPFEMPGNELDEDCNGELVCNLLSVWKNHGAYVSCVTHATNVLKKDGWITEKEKGVIVSNAAKSGVGKKK